MALLDKCHLHMKLVRSSVVNIFTLRSRVVLEHSKHLPTYAPVVLGIMSVQSAKGVLKPPKAPPTWLRHLV